MSSEHKPKKETKTNVAHPSLGNSRNAFRARRAFLTQKHREKTNGLFNEEFLKAGILEGYRHNNIECVVDIMCYWTGYPFAKM